MKRKLVIGAAALLAAGAAGATAAVASGDDGEGTVTGRQADRATAAALEETGGGTANAVERDSENGATWEVEVTTPDGQDRRRPPRRELPGRGRRGRQRELGRLRRRRLTLPASPGFTRQSVRAIAAAPDVLPASLANLLRRCPEWGTLRPRAAPSVAPTPR